MNFAARCPLTLALPDEGGLEVFLAELLYLALVGDAPSHSSKPAVRFRFRPTVLADIGALLPVSILAAWSTLPSH